MATWSEFLSIPVMNAASASDACNAASNPYAFRQLKVKQDVWLDNCMRKTGTTSDVSSQMLLTFSDNGL